MNRGPVAAVVSEAADAADTTRLAAAIGRLVPALEEFNCFQGPDQAAGNRDSWQRQLDRLLPAHGADLDEVLAELAELVIPHGLRNGARGFNGWVTTAPTTAVRPRRSQQPSPGLSAAAKNRSKWWSSSHIAASRSGVSWDPSVAPCDTT